MMQFNHPACSGETFKNHSKILAENTGISYSVLLKGILE